MLEININKGIHVAGHRYQVKSGKHITDRLKEGNFYGRSYHTERELLVDNSLPEPQISNSIIHEAIHAIDTSYDIRLSESQTKRLANGLHQVMEGLGIRFTVKGK